MRLIDRICRCEDLKKQNEQQRADNEGLKKRFVELTSEIAAKEASTAVQQLRSDTLATQVAVLIECYKALEYDFANLPTAPTANQQPINITNMPSYTRLALRCAELEHQLQCGTPWQQQQQQLSQKLVLPTALASTTTLIRGQRCKVPPNLISLLQSACNQLQDAQSMGTRLRDALTSAQGK